MASNITGEGKGRENEHFDYIYYTERRRRLKNLLFLLLQNEALSQSYDRIQSHHKRSFRRYLSNSGWFSNVSENYSDERFETIFKSFKRNIHQYTWFYSRWSTTRISLWNSNFTRRKARNLYLYRLVRGDYYQTISELTGRGIATVRNITQEVSNLIVTKLWKKFVVFPKTEEEFLNSINAMETLWQFPTTFGGVDGCHIPLKCPHGGNEARREYYNFNNFYSLVMMGIVGWDYWFLWASAWLPGSVNDACSFQGCKLYQDTNNEEKLPEIYKTIKGIQIPPFILGDSAFPHHTWLQKPFTCANPTKNKVISILDWAGIEWLLSVHLDSLKDVREYSIESVRQVKSLWK